MPVYKFNGDSPRSLPEYGIEVVSPGETVETVEPLEHPDFEPVTPRKRRSRSGADDAADTATDAGPQITAEPEVVPAEPSPNPESPPAKE